MFLENKYGEGRIKFLDKNNIFQPYLYTNFFKKIIKSNSDWALCLFFQNGVIGQNLIVFFQKYASAFNSFFKVLAISKILLTVRLPSGKIIFLDKFQNHKYQVLRISPLNKKKKIIVRGIAKNPVDHPNGGRTNVKNPKRTPWGFIAKKGK